MIVNESASANEEHEHNEHALEVEYRRLCAFFWSERESEKYETNHRVFVFLFFFP